MGSAFITRRGAAGGGSADSVTQATPVISVDKTSSSSYVKITASATQSAGLVSAGTKTATDTSSIPKYTGSTNVTSNQTLATAGKFCPNNIVVNVPTSSGGGGGNAYKGTGVGNQATMQGYGSSLYLDSQLNSLSEDIKQSITNFSASLDLSNLDVVKENGADVIYLGNTQIASGTILSINAKGNLSDDSYFCVTYVYDAYFTDANGYEISGQRIGVLAGQTDEGGNFIGGATGEGAEYQESIISSALYQFNDIYVSMQVYPQIAIGDYETVVYPFFNSNFTYDVVLW